MKSTCNRRGISLAAFLSSLAFFLVGNGHADWKTDWDQTVRAAEKEGQVNVYIAGYSAIVDAGVFQKAFPKIKVVTLRDREPT